MYGVWGAKTPIFLLKLSPIIWFICISFGLPAKTGAIGIASL